MIFCYLLVRTKRYFKRYHIMLSSPRRNKTWRLCGCRPWNLFDQKSRWKSRGRTLTKLGYRNWSGQADGVESVRLVSQLLFLSSSLNKTAFQLKVALQMSWIDKRCLWVEFMFLLHGQTKQTKNWLTPMETVIITHLSRKLKSKLKKLQPQQNP